MEDDFQDYMTVVPYVGTWIEITRPPRVSWWPLVVPYVGTWIEIPRGTRHILHFPVVPYVGTWIEITEDEKSRIQDPQSFPTWERG